MKLHSLALASLGLILSFGTGVRAATTSQSPLHLDLEMTGPEYATLIERMEAAGGFRARQNDPLRAILNLGKRNLDWLALINAGRAPDAQLELSTPESTVGIPIGDPRRSNRPIIERRRDELRAELPAAMREVLFENAPLTAAPPVADAEFLAFARKVDTLYQAASRWLLQEPYLRQYAGFATNDIRGFYFLEREPELEKKLRQWRDLLVADRDRLSEWLVGQCRNSGRSTRDCRGELAQAALRGDGVWNFHQRHRPRAESLFRGFFAVQNPRREAVWIGKSPDLMTFPFQQPESPEVETWLRENLEDEWKFGPWRLELSFRTGGIGLAHVVFVPGATPNVNGLGGSRITMDANRSIHEYLVRWTIRHEFGHVLGFPDCYIEFYDDEQQVMINYQIDVDNLMCSRRGRLLQTHYDEMKRNYFRP
jgi:hypothetical protein